MAQGAETKLTPLYLKTYAQKFDFKTIFYLDLKERNIAQIGAITDCTNLQTLNLSHNMIGSITGLETLVDLKFLDLSYNKIQQISALEPLRKLQKLELQGNRILDAKSFPPLAELRVLYFQEFLMTGTNPICQQNGYRDKVIKIFPKLLALDGVRKAVPMNCTMVEAIPAEEEVKAEYDTSGQAWFDGTGEIDDPNQAMAVRFEPGTNLKREERELMAMLKDMKELVAKKTNILTY